ncbi:MAG: hypothetical protein ACOCZS_01365 [Verrucomicrobiota bacterium]
MQRINITLFIPFCLVLLAAIPLQVMAVVGELDYTLGRSLQLETELAVDRGAEFLVEDQLENGSWNDHPAITSLATLALANLPDNSRVQAEVAIKKALDYLKQQVQEDGGLWNRKTENYKLYSTAVGVMALVRCNRSEDLAVIGKVRNYLVNSQQKEPEGEGRKVLNGGFAAGPGGEPNLTVTQWVVEALYLLDSLQLPENLRSSAFRTKQEVPRYRQAVEFIERCQVSTEKNHTTDNNSYGCFRDKPVDDERENSDPKVQDSRTPRAKIFLTCLGLKSLRYAGYRMDDVRIQGALDCLRKRYTVKENPGLGEAGYYTYLHALVNALKSLDLPFLEVDGERRFWRPETARELLNRQRGDGSWRHDEPAWWENNPSLSTSYAVLILEKVLLP